MLFTRAVNEIAGGKRGEGKHSTNDRNRKAYNFCQIKLISEIRQKFKDHIE